MLVRKRSIWRITHRNEASLSWLVAREKSFAAHSLNEHGVTIEGARKRVGEGRGKGSSGRRSAGRPITSKPVSANANCPDERFAWHKREWKALDVFRENETGLASFDPALRDDPNFKFVPDGWPKDWC